MSFAFPVEEEGPCNEGIIEKGHTTDDFLDLQHTCKGPPIGFLQQLDLFKEFPCEEFLTNPDATDFRYYGQDKVIVKDTNRTLWIHVVKTGTVKVVRMQPVIDVQNDTKFINHSREELGTCRSFSHAKAMLGVLPKEKNENGGRCSKPTGVNASGNHTTSPRLMDIGEENDNSSSKTKVSDGAEIIKISKRFFLTHAQNNTMLKAETMQRDHMTTKEAKTIMYDKETWNQYKTVLIQRTVENLYRTKMEKA